MNGTESKAMNRYPSDPADVPDRDPWNDQPGPLP
jgi:hypothetical protein